MAAATSNNGDLAEALGTHLANVAENLQLIADLGYGDVSLVVPNRDGDLVVVADARPMTAVASLASTRIGKRLTPSHEPEAYAAFRTGQIAADERRRVARGIPFVTTAFPVCLPEPTAIIIRNLAVQVTESPGTMETVFMDTAERLLAELAQGPLVDAEYGEPFATVRRAGDGVMRIDADGTVAYASPNSVNIMRLAGIEGTVAGQPVTRLPGAEYAVNPVLTAPGALRTEIETGDRVIGYRTINLGEGAVAFVEDITDARHREQELKVKEATIREVHHRVKNNLQTIASLLRLQGRRADSAEVSRALAEATERVASMAVVHELLASSDDERIDFAEAAQTVVDMVRRGLGGESNDITVTLKGSSGSVPAPIATSLALVLAELVHNAIEHGFEGRGAGAVEVRMRRLAHEFVLSVRDDGVGLAADFDVLGASNLGLEIVRTIVEDDLHGTLSFGKGKGTTVTVRFPLEADGEGLSVRVIIAEDESIIRMDLREMLEEEGHEVVAEAGNGAEAIAMTREHKPQVVFMDVEMPEVDGLEAARVIGEERLSPVVMVTAFSQAAYVKKATEAGAMAYLTKPFTKRDILPAMEIATSRFVEATTLADEVKDLSERLETRKLVDRAKALLMAKGMSESEAFSRLQKLAMDTRLPLKQVAEAVILAGEADTDGDANDEADHDTDLNPDGA